MFAAITVVLGTVGTVAIQPASATVNGNGGFSNNQQNDQSSCEVGCDNLQNAQQNSKFKNNQGINID
jgi:hypothetical protein